MNSEGPNPCSWDICSRTFLSLHLRLFELQVDYLPGQYVTSGQSTGVSKDRI